MGMSVGNKKLHSHINITPYIDILLVLLIIFMIVTPMKQHPIRVPQPPLENQPREIKQDTIIVDMDLDHSVRLNQEPMTLEMLETSLTEVFRHRTVKEMFIRGDSTLPYGAVFVLLDIAKRSGVEDIALLEKNGATASAAIPANAAGPVP
ncbi:MAG TPA: biopolymer transporter ExbD [Acidobacteriota bacterium]|nr:biopolymer transporter ExbD [Acidobacteriota bacterium]